ncbi:MAG: hypothetical protein ACI8Z1_002432 [Candidatus Azotimanducaceae bacterium]|jgi:hypothetical protein
MAIIEIAVLALIAAALIVAAMQLHFIRRNLEANSFQEKSQQRIGIWTAQLEKEALYSARDKFFEHELYKRDVLFPEIDELTLRERRAIISAYNIEIIYFQNLFYQNQRGIISEEQSKPLHYMRCMMDAPQRRYWKDFMRQNNHYPAEYVAHVDSVVKKYDQVEEVMDLDQNAEFEAVVLKVFDVPPPPVWFI